jgi:hypothetical protein
MPWRGDADEAAGFQRDDPKLVLIQSIFQPAQDGGNLADRVRIARRIFELSAHGKPKKISCALAGVKAFRVPERRPRILNKDLMETKNLPSAADDGFSPSGGEPPCPSK